MSFSTQLEDLDAIRAVIMLRAPRDDKGRPIPPYNKWVDKLTMDIILGIKALKAQNIEIPPSLQNETG